MIVARMQGVLLEVRAATGDTVVVGQTLAVAGAQVAADVSREGHKLFHQIFRPSV